MGVKFQIEIFLFCRLAFLQFFMLSELTLMLAKVRITR